MTEEKITPNFPSGHDFKKAKEGTSAEEEKLQNLRDHVKESLNRLGYQKDFEPIGGMSDSIERLVGMSLDKGALLERTQFIDGLLESCQHYCLKEKMRLSHLLFLCIMLRL